MNTRLLVGFLMVLSSMVGCTTIPTMLNDRLPVQAEKSIADQHKGHPALAFSIDQKTREFTYTGGPSGIIGRATTRSFPIGVTFSAYLEQAQKAAFSPLDRAAPIPIGTHIADCQIRYTNSAIAFVGIRRAIEWVNLTLTVEALFPWSKEPAKIIVHREVEATPDEMAGATVGYRPVEDALAGAVSDYMTEVVRQVAKEKPSHVIK